MSSKHDLLMAAMAAEFPHADVPRLGEGEDVELGSWEGPDIPRELWERQQWSGATPALRNDPNPPINGVPLLRVSLPHKYARDWTIQFACPAPRGAGAFNNAGFTSTGRVVLRWGHNGSMDEVDLTWPARGGAVTVHGSSVEVLYFDSSAVNCAAVAWVDQGRASRTTSGYKPCLVTAAGPMPYAGFPVVMTLAKRCRSFAVAFVSPAVTDQGILRVRQQEANANPLVDTYYADAITGAANFNSDVMLHETLVHHFATELELTNFSTFAESELLNVMVLQYLDLG